MAVHIVGISDLYVSNDADDTIKTFSLGSCIGVAVYDPVAVVGGLLHIMLPLSDSSPDKAQLKPGMFADTGLNLLLKRLRLKGAVKERMIVSIAGGSTMMDQSNFFNIGQRNYAAIRKVLWKESILIKAQDIGGSLSRTMWLEMKTGRVIVKSTKGELELWK
ncbi:MAG: chemotaxis protein CheD [Candidatus Zixiibacteriota bacterium]